MFRSYILLYYFYGEKAPLCILFPAVNLPEYVHPPASHGREEPRAEVSRRVYWIAAVQTHGHTDGHDDQANAQRLHPFWSTDIPLVSNGQDAQDQCCGRNYLRKHKHQKISTRSNTSKLKISHHYK